MASVVVEVVAVVVMRAFFGCGGEVVVVEILAAMVESGGGECQIQNRCRQQPQGKDLAERLSSYVMLMGT